MIDPATVAARLEQRRADLAAGGEALSGIDAEIERLIGLRQNLARQLDAWFGAIQALEALLPASDPPDPPEQPTA
ncbi:MAG: hypothetical protein OHK0022_28030 [Roseiflexaceae bacterium]